MPPYVPSPDVQRDDPSVFGPWYDYLTVPELLFLAGVAVAAVATLWAGATDPATDLEAAVGVALLSGGFIAFFVRWSVSEERAARLPALEEEY
jgi:hypothetical protein